MKLNKLSLSLAITLALGSTFGMAHAETTAAHTKTKATTVTNTQAKATPAKATTAKTTTKADTKAETKATTAKTEAKPATTEHATEAKAEAKPAAKTTEAKTTTKAKETLPAGVYTDTKDNWARDAIQAMSQAGYLSGYSDNTFKPSAQITREQAAAIYGKVLQHNLNEQELADIVTKESATSYSDVEADRWSNSAIKLVSAAGVMQGTSKTAFTPSKTMNREEFVASAASLAKKLNITTPVKTEKIRFKDEDSISLDYVADINYMAERGIVASGTTENFNPKQPVTRAQAATILNRMLNGAGLATPKHAAPEAKAETAVKEDAKKVEKAVEKDASKVSKDAKKDVAKLDKDAKKDAAKADKAVKEDAKKAEKAAKADAKKVEKDVKHNKNEAVAQKTEPTRTVRPVRRSTLKALDQKQQSSLEDKVFVELNKTYKTPEAFQDYGVMYWRDNQLHVALKSDSDISTVKANLASRGDSTVNNYVVVEPSQYSQTEYDAIDANFRNYYSKNEKAGTILATFPDVENNQLYAVVSTASKDTQQGISKLFGSKVKMTVKR
ncbi:S-layer homology domain-containing protein [Veillonella sp.]|uniref:S-layer homology domain-containing protein n=1 Tax=Veillonella sp. TaxID=1926307 RepID=UPI0028FEA3E0|nr:S-layer homology domain-containing protein [Veillonella sp.]MDU1130767.1 S-layer homology domain-containing protein [Veillonella sp.]MDU2869576.1 S-layer homology domain-containing protein [Veillonella sp.]MDU2930816.1 S-layer homology domain-containing protein [Veillonella sp.]